jgi:hypothetical protein
LKFLLFYFTFKKIEKMIHMRELWKFWTWCATAKGFPTKSHLPQRANTINYFSLITHIFDKAAGASMINLSRQGASWVQVPDILELM